MALTEHCVQFQFEDNRPKISACATEAFSGLALDDFRFPAGCDLKITVPGPDGKNKILFEGGEMLSNPIRLTVLRGKGIQVTNEIEVTIGDIKKYYSFLTQDITCRKNECTISKEKCALQIPHDIYPEALTEFQKIKIQEGGKKKIVPNSGTIADNDSRENLAEKLYVRALSGDHEAARALEELRLATDSTSSSEILDGYKGMYKDIRKSCPSLP